MNDEEIVERVSKIKRPLVLHHGPGCRDGFCAAYLAHLRFPGAELVPQEYGDPFEFDPNPEPEDDSKIRLRVRGEWKVFDLAGRDVLMLDWSPSSREDSAFGSRVLDGVRSRARSLLVLDHHEKQAPVLEGRDDAIFDASRSGCGIALDAFFPGSRRGEGISGTGFRLVGGSVADLALRCEAWDLWKHDRYPDVKEVCAYVDTFPRDVEKWTMLSGLGLHEMFRAGAAVLAYQRQQVERVVAHAKEVRWEDLGIVTVVNSPVLQSEVGEALYEIKPERASVVWYLHESGDVVVSLRSKEGVGPDVGEAAKRRGGGGHRHSAGFRVKPWENRDAFGVGFGNLLGVDEVAKLGGRPFAQGVAERSG